MGAKDNTKSMQKDNSAPRETIVSIEYWTTMVSDVQDIVFQTVLKDKSPKFKMESTQEDVHCLLSALLLNIVRTQLSRNERKTETIMSCYRNLLMFINEIEYYSFYVLYY